MSTELLLCISQEISKHPYKFTLTNIKVYSFEEALYHSYHYWQHSFEDIFSEEFILWISKELGLNVLSSRVKEITKIKNFSNKMLNFLTIIEFFSNIELKKIKHELIQWETTMEWERLKQHGDYLVKNNYPEIAVNIYKKALNYGEHIEIFNNLGIALMKIEKYLEAEFYLNKAFKLNNANLQILLNLTEAAIHNNNFEFAIKLLDMVDKKDKNNPFLHYLFGELNIATGNTTDAIQYYKKAYDISKDNFYLYCLSDLYVSIRQYSSAVEVLQSVTELDKKFFIKLSEVHSKSNNISEAIGCIKEGIKIYNYDCELITILAKYYRLDNNLEESLASINIALKLEPNNENVSLEYARINKAKGSIKEYQSILNKLVMTLKNNYNKGKQSDID